MKSIIDIARQRAQGNQSLVPTLIKEILHYDILRAISASPLSSKIVFQGGTSLRLCHDNARYSEDLDFVLNDIDTELKPTDIESFRDTVVRSINKEWGLPITVTGPDDPAFNAEADHIEVKKWTAKIQIPKANPAEKNPGIIRVEIAHVCAYDAFPMFIRNNFAEHLARPQIILRVESREEILADKLIAFAYRPRWKFRDLWDIKFLCDNRIKLNPKWYFQKAQDYRQIASQEDADSALDAILKRSAELGKSINDASFQKAFQAEMTRFVDAPLAKQLEDRDVCQGFLRSVQYHVDRSIQQLEQHLSNDPDNTPAGGLSLKL